MSTEQLATFSIGVLVAFGLLYQGKIWTFAERAQCAAIVTHPDQRILKQFLHVPINYAAAKRFFHEGTIVRVLSTSALLVGLGVLTLVVLTFALAAEEAGQYAVSEGIRRSVQVGFMIVLLFTAACLVIAKDPT